MAIEPIHCHLPHCLRFYLVSTTPSLLHTHTQVIVVSFGRIASVSISICLSAAASLSPCNLLDSAQWIYRLPACCSPLSCSVTSFVFRNVHCQCIWNCKDFCMLWENFYVKSFKKAFETCFIINKFRQLVRFALKIYCCTPCCRTDAFVKSFNIRH